MNKFELITTLREKAHLNKPEVSTVVELFVDNMADTLPGGRVGNPKTGDKVAIKTKKLPFFKAGKELKMRVNR